MVQQLNQQTIEFEGTDQEQAVADEIFNLMRMYGFSYADNRPIRQTLTNLAQYLSERKFQGIEKVQEMTGLVDKALTANLKVFRREEENDTVAFVTTKSGVAPALPTGQVDHHSFRTRLYADAKPVVTPTPAEQAAQQQASNRAAEANPLQLPTAAPLPLSTAAPTARPTAASIAPTLPAKAAPVPTTAPKKPETVVVPVAIKPTTPIRPAETEVAVEVAEQAPVVATSAPAESETVASEPVTTAEAARELELAPDVVADLSLPTNQLLSEYGGYFRSSLLKGIVSDSRFVNFANEWYLEEMTGRYSKGDLRRIREYILEVGGPVTDADILSDLYNKRTNEGDYTPTRFALDYRLAKEKKDFEFVGTVDERIWTTAGVPTIGTTRHKAAEIGTDYKYLEDPNLVDPNELTGEPGKYTWEHILTFYEYENGVLPYDVSAKAIFPKLLQEDQKSVILRFEATQLGVVYNAELRYPSGNRGGWIVGLESFFSDNLVPGAILVVRQTNRTNQFTIEYKQGDEQEARLLFWDERRQKFVFRPIIFACAINKEEALTPDRYSRIDGQRRLEESERKRTDFVLANAFEYAGQKQGDSYYTLLDDLYPIANIERPFSRNYLRSLLTSGNNQFRLDETTPDAFFYKPASQGRR